MDRSCSCEGFCSFKKVSERMRRVVSIDRCRIVSHLIGSPFSLIDSFADVHLWKSVTKSTDWVVLAHDIVNQKEDFNLENHSVLSVLTSNTLGRRDNFVTTLPERLSVVERSEPLCLSFDGRHNRRRYDM